MTAKQMHEHCTKNWQWAREYYRPWNDLFGRLLAFCLDLEHYKRETGYTNDRRRIQPKGQQLFNLVRHKLAQLSTAALNLMCSPVQPMMDGTKAEVSKRLIEQTIYDPMRRYKVVRHRMILAALAAGRGATAIEYDPRIGVCFRNVDPRRLHTCPGYYDLHDPRNPWVIEEVPMRLSAVRAMKSAGWSVPRDLMPDDWKSDYGDGNQQDTSRIQFDGDSNKPGADEGNDTDGIVTILKCFYRAHPDGSSQPEAPSRALPRDEWHYRSPDGQRIPAGPGLEDGTEEPPMGMDGMPLPLVTENDAEDQFPTAPDGYLCIVAPFYKGQKPLFEDYTWLPGKVNEDVVLSAFPYMQMLGYRHPLRLVGTSDTQLNHSMQVIDNASFRAAWEQMRMAQAIMVFQRGALVDESDRNFVLTDQPIQIAYAKDRMAAEAVQIHQAPGMNAAMPQFRTMLNQQWAYIGSGDIAMPAERSRDIAVGTMQAMQQMGDLPVRLHLEDLGLEESIGFRVVLDYTRAYMTAKQMVTWVADDGDQMYAEVTAEDLAPMNVMVAPPGEKSVLDTERLQAISQFAGQTSQSPELMMALLAETNFSPETKRALGQLAQRMMAMQQMQMQPPQGAEGAPPQDEGAPVMQ
jgi:hypothetical protein